MRHVAFSARKTRVERQEWTLPVHDWSAERSLAKLEDKRANVTTPLTPKGRIVNKSFSFHTACAMLQNVYLGLQVVLTELQWMFGEDWAHTRHTRPMQARRDAMRVELTQLTLTADAGREALSNDLNLLDEDIAALQLCHAERHAKRLAELPEACRQNLL